MKAVINTLKKILLVIMGLLTGLNAVTISISVLSRYVFNLSLGWPDELAAVSLAWITFLGAACAVMEDKMMSFNGLLEKFPAKAQAVTRILIHCIMLAFIIIFITSSNSLVVNAFHARAASMPISKGILYAVMPVSGLLMSFALVHFLIKEVRGLIKT